MSAETEIGTVPQCYTHADRAAGGFCVSCGKPICPDCTVEVGGKYHCKGCVAEKIAPAHKASSQSLSSFSNSQWMGFCGCILISIGTFAPVISYLGESTNFFQQGQSDGSIILVAVAASVALLIKKMYAFLWLSGGLSWRLFYWTSRMPMNSLTIADWPRLAVPHNLNGAGLRFSAAHCSC